MNSTFDALPVFLFMAPIQIPKKIIRDNYMQWIRRKYTRRLSKMTNEQKNGWKEKYLLDLCKRTQLHAYASCWNNSRRDIPTTTILKYLLREYSCRFSFAAKHYHRWKKVCSKVFIYFLFSFVLFSQSLTVSAIFFGSCAETRDRLKSCVSQYWLLLLLFS